MASNVAIKAIDSSAIHQIQSGQVIVDLCSVAKELVENSIDAGATAIGRISVSFVLFSWASSGRLTTTLAKEVRFKNQGLDSIEVQDNGSGIAPHNYESIALKHYTSKLSSYDDLSTLHTFGFRGEALSSLCALSRFSIVTCTQDEAPRATRIEFEASGKLRSTSVVSGQRGTTVFVEDLFHNLPVRRRELERNIKREWGKVISLLNQYACVQTGVKFTVSQQPTKGKRMILFSTKGNRSTRENIINVFGVKTMNALITMDLKLELTPTTGPLNKGKARADSSTTAEVRVLGHISRPTHGEGRQTPDRQMFYVNGRPCGLPQFAKVFNEVYRTYNASQSPFIFADIQLDTHLYDVNVSPDKRTILLHDQGQMLDNLRESLIELFETQDVTIPVQAPSLKQTPFKLPTFTRSETPASAQGGTNRAATIESQHEHMGNDGAEGNDGASDHDGESEPEEYDEPRSRAEKRKSRKSENLPVAKAQGPTLLSRWLRPDTDFREHSGTEAPDAQNRGRSISDVIPPSSPAAEGEVDSQEHGGSRDRASPSNYDADEPDYHATQVKDFHAPFAKPHDQSELNPGETGHRDPSDGQATEEVEPEPPVLAIAPPSQPPAPRTSPVGTARPLKRPPQEVATITIGDHTVTSVIGTPSKRRRVEEPSKSTAPRGSGKAAQRNAALPSFGGRLSQLFSASSRPDEAPVETLGVVAEDAETEEVETGPEHDDLGGDCLFVSEADNERIGDEGGHGDEEEGSETQIPTSAQRDDSEAAGDAESLQEPVGHTPSCHGDHDGGDDEYVSENEKKAREDQKVQEMISAAEATTGEPTEEGEKRSQMFIKGRAKRKEMTLNLAQQVKVSATEIQQRITTLANHLPQPQPSSEASDNPGGLEADDAEEKLSLKISKSDFARMRIVGQFNLGFILAVREAAAATSSASPSASSPSTSDDRADDELFIIDQHASDEKYNFERLQATTTVQSQRLVQPKTLELTALEEEVILEHLPALERNGFLVRADTSGLRPVGARCQLLSLPLSRETTFSVSDLEELVFLLAENPTSSATTVPRPSKVRKMFAMRACRSSIMIGRALSRRQMEKVVRHMGEMEKPWNCPHGRPTMRHLCGLGGVWQGRLWEEGEHRPGKTDWAAWAREKRGEE